MAEQPDIDPELAAQLEPAIANFRLVSQVYADQLSLLRRTGNAVAQAFTRMEAGGPSILFDLSKDPLGSLSGGDDIVEQQARVVDLLVMAALGQTIDLGEFQSYAQSLAAAYADYDFLKKAPLSAVKDQALRDIEQEWKEGTDLGRVQHFFRVASVGVEYAGRYCGVRIVPLPPF